MHELPLSAYEDIMRVNYMGTVHVTKAVLPAMLQRGSGHLVFVSSSMGLLGAKLLVLLAFLAQNLRVG